MTRRRDGRSTAMAIGALALVVAMAAPTQAYPRPGRTERVSVSSDGVEGNYWAQAPDLSADGRLVAFDSYASTLVPGDTNRCSPEAPSCSDVFVHDRDTGTTERISVSSDGTQGNLDSFFPSLSADGRYVAFHTTSNNLVPGDTNGQPDVFVHDREAGTTERVSVASDGKEGTLGGSGFSSLSADGRFVAFSSTASNLVPGDTNGRADVFVRDRQSGTTERIVVTAEGVVGSQYPDISADGRYVAFQTIAANVATLGGRIDVYVHDRETGTTELVSAPAFGSLANTGAWSASGATISGDGRYVAFVSGAPNLIPGDTNPGVDVFVRDRQTGTTERVSVTSDGSEANGASGGPSISPDGRFVGFNSDATNLVPGDTNGVSDAFVHDRVTGTTERVSVASDGTQGTATAFTPKVSPGGRIVALVSASNLVPGDGNGRSDVYVRDRGEAVGVGGLTVEVSAGEAAIDGWATFSGAATAVSDPSSDGGSGARETGGELTGASVAFRPERGDLQVRWSVADLAPVAAGVPGALYGLELSVGGRTYEVRALRAGGAAAPPGTPYFALYECGIVCLEVARLSGGFGTTGKRIVASVPLSSLGTAEGAVLTGIRAFTGLGEAGSGAARELDEALLPPIDLLRRVVTLGIAPTGTPEEQVEFDTATVLSDGLFSGDLAVDSLDPGEYDVWARGCLGDMCGADSVALGIG